MIDIAIPALNGLQNVRYLFTTRRNGLGQRTGGMKKPDDWNAVAESFGIDPRRLVTANQVHGETIVLVDGSNFTTMASTDADAMITREPGIAIGVETADCVPVLLVDPKTPAIAAIHAGWRSTVRRIAQKTVSRMNEEFGSDPERIIAAIGPAIGPECYEVDEPVMGPVREAFSFWRDVATVRQNGRYSLDLQKLNRILFIEAGLPAVNVYTLGLCTSCNPELFYSFRREGRTGRMLSAVMIKP